MKKATVTKRTKKALQALLIAATLLATTYGAVFAGHYRYGSGNQGEVIPIHMRLEDPDFLTQDAYVNGLQEYNVRTNFAYFMYFSQNLTFDLLDYSEIYLFYFVTITFLSLLGIYLLTEFFAKDLVHRLIILILVPVTPVFAIGSVFLFPISLLANSFATLFIIWALYLFLKKKYYLAFGLLVLATYFHVLLGLLAAIFISAILLTVLLSKKDPIKKTAAKALPILGLYALLALPALLPHIWDALSSNGADSQQVAYIIAFFRNPHHYVPSTWGAQRLATFFLLEIAAVVCIFFSPIKKNKILRNSLLTFFAATNLMFLAGYVFVELVTIPAIAKLQLYRISIINELVIKLILASTLIHAIQTVFRKIGLKKSLAKTATSLLLIAIIAIFAYNGREYFNNKLSYKPSQPPDKQKVAFEWIIENTPEDATILTSVHESDIRLRVNRGIVVTFKQFVFKDDQVLDWYERLQDFCGMEEPDCTGWDCPKYCKKKFEEYDEDDITYLGYKYDAEYVLTSGEHELDFELLYQDDNYSIYKIPPNEDETDS